MPSRRAFFCSAAGTLAAAAAPPVAAPSDIRITEVRPLIIGGRTLFVLVRASNGMFGLGECSPMSLPIIAAHVDHGLKPGLIGKDPSNVEPLYDEMLYPNFKLGPMGAVSEAIAGVDIALWDLKGKILGQPVCKLLGGKYRDRQPMSCPPRPGGPRK